ARLLVARALGAAHAHRLEEGLRVFLEYYAAHLLDQTRAYPGVPVLLDELAARGVTLSVLTNKAEALSRRILDGLGMLGKFAAVVGGDSLPSRKPDPQGLESLRARAGTPRERLLMVGDSPIDVQTAGAATVAFCGVAWGLTPAALRAAWGQPLVAH